MPSFILIRQTVWPQYTNVTDRQTGQDRQRSDSIGRTVLQMGAQKRKPNTTKAHINRSKEMYYNTISTRKLKPGLVASYDIRPGNGEGLFWFRRFINLSLTYLLRHLYTYSQPGPTWGDK